MPDPKYTKLWHGVPRQDLAWHPTVVDEACIGLAQKFGVEEAFRIRGIALESAATAFPRFAIEGATVMTF